jgi:hypothetical protein
MNIGNTMTCDLDAALPLLNFSEADAVDPVMGVDVHDVTNSELFRDNDSHHAVRMPCPSTINNQFGSPPGAGWFAWIVCAAGVFADRSCPPTTVHAIG